MKNLKYVYKFILVVPLLFMVGCIGTDDYSDVVSNQYSQQSTVFIETDDASEITRTVPGNVAQPIEVGVNNAPSSDITVSFSVTKDGGDAVEGVDYMISDATILASEDCELVLVARRKKPLQDTAKLIAKKYKTKVFILSLDVTSKNADAKIKNFALSKLGSIDILINSSDRQLSLKGVLISKI